MLGARGGVLSIPKSIWGRIRQPSGAQNQFRVVLSIQKSILVRIRHTPGAQNRFWEGSVTDLEAWNGRKSIRGNLGGHFGSISWVLDSIGALEGPEAKFGHFWSKFWPSLTPLPTRSIFLWSEMACTGVPNKELHLLSSSCTYWGQFGPSIVSFSTILAVSGDKNIPFQLILPLHLRHSAPNFKTYIFGMLIHFLIDLLKRNFWYFFWIWWIFGTHVAYA